MAGIGAFIITQQVLVVGTVSTDNISVQYTGSIYSNAGFPLTDCMAVAAMKGRIITKLKRTGAWSDFAACIGERYIESVECCSAVLCNCVIDRHTLTEQSCR